MKRTLVLGASPNPDRYSYKAVEKINRYGHQVFAVGIRKGNISGIEIQIGYPEIEDIHTTTLYIGSARQPQYYDYILSLRPKRIIFNPGAENYELVQLASKQDIEVVEGCTLVMLSTGEF